MAVTFVPLSPSDRVKQLLILWLDDEQTGTSDIPLTEEGVQLIKGLAPQVVGEGSEFLGSPSLSHSLDSLADLKNRAPRPQEPATRLRLPSSACSTDF